MKLDLKGVMVSEQQYSATDVMFTLRVLMEKFSEWQKDLHSVCGSRAVDRIPREEQW